MGSEMCIRDRTGRGRLLLSANIRRGGASSVQEASFSDNAGISASGFNAVSVVICPGLETAWVANVRHTDRENMRRSKG